MGTLITTMGPGIVVALIGAMGLTVALVVRGAWRDLQREGQALARREESLERRETAVADHARALYEWEGRLLQVAECGHCPLPRGPRPARHEDGADR